MNALRAVVVLIFIGSTSTASAEMLPHARIAPGMTITEVQALIGPPYAIKSLNWREVLFFCPASWLGVSIGQQIYTTVWLVHRRVVASRTLIEPNLDTCEKFTAAFQWTDPPPFSTSQHRSEWYGQASIDRPTHWQPARKHGR